MSADNDSCVACGGSLRALWSSPDRLDSAATYAWLKCGRCGFIRIAEGAAGSSHDACYSDEDPSAGLQRWLQMKLMQPEIAFVDRHLPADGDLTVLEIGCGTGLFASAISGLGRRRLRILGIEPRTASASAARDAGVEMVGADLDSALIAAESVDAVVLIHTLEHIADPVEYLRKIRQLLRPDGLLVIALPAADSLEARLFGRRWYGLDAPRHRWLPSRRALRSLVQGAGFAIEEISGWSLRTPLVGFAASVAPSLEPAQLRRLARNSRWKALAGQIGFAGLMTLLAPVTVFANVIGFGSSVNLAARKETSHAPAG